MEYFSNLTTENKFIVLIMIIISIIGFILFFRKGFLYKLIGFLITLGILSLYLYFFKKNYLFISLFVLLSFLIELLTSFFYSKPDDALPKQVYFLANKLSIYISNVNT